MPKPSGRAAPFSWNRSFPICFFAKDGEIYDFSGKRCLAIGGAYSMDKENGRVDIVLTHTCPLQYEPTEVFLPGIDQSTVDKSTEEWLGTIERRLSYEKWYCGHYHTSKQVGRIVFMFQDIRTFPVDG